MLPIDGADRITRQGGARPGGLVLPRLLRRPVRQARRAVGAVAQLGARGYAMLALVLLAVGGAGLVSGNEAVRQSAEALVAQASAVAGFRIAAIDVNGNRELSKIDIIANIDLGDTRSLFSFDVHGAREALRGLPWVHDVTVKKSYPDRLLVDVVERQPIALWQDERQLWLIDRSGTVIAEFDERFGRLPLVVGRGANAAAAGMLAVAARHPQLAAGVRAYVRVGDRRWNLAMKDGPTVLLPQDGEESALIRLAALDRDKAIMSRDITHLDLRLADRIAIGLGETAMATHLQRVETQKQAAAAAEPRI